ncbi:hypothetical protein [Rhodoferax sp. GW822-FHT02A01]|uniref:hypothetical protein n=1 Tax=Rhodoferax sp. GW822-FHT02A01 TaxID=3141537 RepID=UPI00315D3995
MTDITKLEAVREALAQIEYALRFVHKKNEAIASTSYAAMADAGITDKCPLALHEDVAEQAGGALVNASRTLATLDRIIKDAREAEPVAHFGSAYVNENGVHITTVLGSIAIPQDASLYLHQAPQQPASEVQREPVGEIVAEDMGKPFNAIQIRTHFYKEVPPVGTKLYTKD